MKCDKCSRVGLVLTYVVKSASISLRKHGLDEMDVMNICVSVDKSAFPCVISMRVK